MEAEPDMTVGVIFVFVGICLAIYGVAITRGCL